MSFFNFIACYYQFTNICIGSTSLKRKMVYFIDNKFYLLIVVKLLSLKTLQQHLFNGSLN